MTKEEVLQILKENLKIEIEKNSLAKELTVYLLLQGEVISEHTCLIDFS